MVSGHEIVQIGWTPSLEGWLTIECSDGEWLGDFSKGVGMCSAYMTELCEVFEGLKYARRL